VNQTPARKIDPGVRWWRPVSCVGSSNHTEEVHVGYEVGEYAEEYYEAPRHDTDVIVRSVRCHCERRRDGVI
jgi:hypothetical protein